MKQKKILMLIFMSSIFCMEPVSNLSINKFMGKWYVISAIPNFVEKGCTDAYDIYKLNQDGTISVEYYAIKNGESFSIMQEATIVDTINYSTWNMRFIKPWIPFYSAPYKVIILDKINYNYMVVGYPGNDYGWIMSREKNMENKLYLKIMNELEQSFNYDKEKFEMIIHNKD